MAKPIVVTDETDWPTLLDDAVKAPVLLERKGVVYRLGVAEADLTYGHTRDSEYVQAVLDATIGSWADLDGDKLLADFYAARRAGSRPPDRP